MLKKKTHLLAGSLIALGFSLSAGATEIVLFQPGQSSWEWLLVPSSHDGGKRMREGKTCLFCHAGEEQAIGNLIASGEKLEPQTLDGMPGFVAANVDASFDDAMVHLSLSWQDLSAAIPWGHEDAEIHLTISIGSAALNVAPIAGCWAACHADLPGMPDAQNSELTKYLPGSRNKMTRSGGGNDMRSAAELDQQIAQGSYLEYWQAVMSDGALASVSDGYFLAARVANADSAVTAIASLQDGRWQVELSRPLAPAGKARMALDGNTEYTMSIALHLNHASGRHHYTSFPMRFRLGPGEAELIATYQ